MNVVNLMLMKILQSHLFSVLKILYQHFNCVISRYTDKKLCVMLPLIIVETSTCNSVCIKSLC